MRVLDGAVACFDGVAGVEPQSETVWRQADKYGVPRMCFINKLDRTGANFEYCVQSIIDRLGAKPAVLYLPIGIEGGFKGLVDLVENRAIIWLEESLGAKFEYQDIPDDLKDKAAAGAHRPDRAGHRPGRRCDGSLSRGHRARHGDAQEADPQGHAGDGVRARSCAARRSRTRASSPCSTPWSTICRARSTFPPIKGILPNGDEDARPSDDDAPFSALAFKIMNDPFVGTLTFARIYSGKLETASQVTNSVKDKKEKVGRMLLMHANDREDIQVAYAGDIVALAGLKDTTTGRHAVRA